MNTDKAISPAALNRILKTLHQICSISKRHSVELCVMTEHAYMCTHSFKSNLNGHGCVLFLRDELNVKQGVC